MATWRVSAPDRWTSAIVSVERQSQYAAGAFGLARAELCEKAERPELSFVDCSFAEVVVAGVFGPPRVVNARGRLKGSARA